MPQNGVGSMLVKSINGIGLVALLGVVAMGAVKWNNVENLRREMERHCLEQKEVMAEQIKKDRNQDGVYEMLNLSLNTVQTNTELLKEQMAEARSDIKKLLERK